MHGRSLDPWHRLSRALTVFLPDIVTTNRGEKSRGVPEKILARPPPLKCSQTGIRQTLSAMLARYIDALYTARMPSTCSLRRGATVHRSLQTTRKSSRSTLPPKKTRMRKLNALATP